MFCQAFILVLEKDIMHSYCSCHKRQADHLNAQVSPDYVML